MATGSNNFKIFNESMDADRTLNDSDYSQSTQRQSGVISGVAQSKLHNKLYRQVSVMAKAIANLISDKGYDCVDTDIEGITFNLEKAIKAMAGDSIEKHNDDYSSHSVALNFWQKSKVYALGNIIFPKVHGSQYCFVCTQAGTTGASEPSWVYTDNTVITDNTCKWAVSRIAAARDFVFATTATALVSGGTGDPGKSSTYARGDHTHTLPEYLNILTRSKSYQLDDIAYSNMLPSWAYVECIQAGTTGASEPSLNNVKVGDIITDGGVKWQVKKIGSGSGKALGDMYHSMCIDPPEGSVRFDGTEYTQALFPDFYKQLVDGKIPSLTYAQWQTQFAANANVGLCALDTVNKKFKVGLIDSSTFIGQALIGQLGSFVAAGIPNILGGITQTSANGSSLRGGYGAIQTVDNIGNPSANIIGSPIWASSLNFDASRSSPVYRADVTTVLPKHIRYPIYLVVANATVPASQAQYDAFMGALGGKANNDLSNCTVPVLVERWYSSDDSAGYEIWSDGTLDQWGYINVTAEVQTINFFKNFSNTTYTVNLQGSRSNEVSSVSFVEKYTVRTTSTMVVYASAGNFQKINWRVRGKKGV